MSLYENLEIIECGAVSDVLHTISQETDVDEEELWTVASGVLSDPDFLENAGNELRIRNLFMLHLSVNSWNGPNSCRMGGDDNSSRWRGRF